MTLPPIVVRSARQGDVPAIQHVARVAWHATYAGQIADVDIEQFLESAYSVRHLQAEINRLVDGFVIAECGGAVIGFAMAGQSRDGVPELFAIYVLPEYHGVGAGHLLWTAARDALARRGMARMCCWVLASNVRARRFYERQGAYLSEEREFAVGASMIREVRYCLAPSG